MTFFTEVKCCRCSEAFGLARETYDTLQRSSAIFRCPWGHEQHFAPGETEADKMRRERDRLKQQLAQKDDDIRYQRLRREQAERSAIAFKGVATRLKNKAVAAECPCCSARFMNLAQHLKSKHPEFEGEALVSAAEELPAEDVAADAESPERDGATLQSGRAA